MPCHFTIAGLLKMAQRLISDWLKWYQSLVFLTSVQPSILATLKDISFAKKYLKQFHYISPLKNGNHDFTTSLELFQRFMKLPVTGYLDDDTIKEMRKPRCGFPDIEEDLETTSPHSRVKRFAAGPSTWNRTHLTYGIFNTGNDMTAAQVKNILKKAFKIWSDKTVLNFTYVVDVNVADIKISFGSRKHGSCVFEFDGPGNVLAHAFYPQDGDLHFDDDEQFTDASYTGINLLAVAVHEIGHLIGIGHSSEKNSVMNPQYSGYDPNLRLHSDDINAAASLYGGTTVPERHPTPPTCVDQLDFCSNYAHLCSKYPTTRKYCPDTCGVCSQGSLTCSDDFSQSVCESFKKIGFCNKPYVRAKCRKTCRIPGSPC